MKPLFKGEGCHRHNPKSYIPVALLSGMSRIMEAILARQIDENQEKNRGTWIQEDQRHKYCHDGGVGICNEED